MLLMILHCAGIHAMTVLGLWWYLTSQICCELEKLQSAWPYRFALGLSSRSTVCQHGISVSVRQDTLKTIYIQILSELVDLHVDSFYGLPFTFIIKMHGWKSLSCSQSFVQRD